MIGRIPMPAPPPSPPPPRLPARGALRFSLIAACWAYPAILLLVWMMIGWSPPEFWPSHLLPYGPRWILLLPAPAVVPLSILLRSRWSASAAGSVTILFAGACGYNIPWANLLLGGARAGSTLRLLTCNVQLGDLRSRDLADLIRSERPDVVLLQEWRPGNPREIAGAAGWYTRSEGEFCLISRYPIVEFEALRRPDKAYRIIAVRAKVVRPGGMVPIVGVHLMTPRDGLEAILHDPLRGIGTFRNLAKVQRFESGLLRRWVEEGPGSMLLAGDFNLTAEHPLFRRDWSDRANAFARSGWGPGTTMFTRHIGLRIDHILCGRDWEPIRCSVGPDVGSSHRPVMAELSWKGPAPGQ